MSVHASGALAVGGTVTLRAMAAEDVPQLYAWYLDAPEMLLGGKTFGIDWLYKVQADEAQWRWSVDADGRLAGFGTLWRNLACGPGVLSPTVVVDPAQRRRGIASLALSGMLLFAERHIPEAAEVRAGVYGDNGPSLRLAARVFGPLMPTLSTDSAGRETFTFSRHLRRMGRV